MNNKIFDKHKLRDVLLILLSLLIIAVVLIYVRFENTILREDQYKKEILESYNKKQERIIYMISTLEDMGYKVIKTQDAIDNEKFDYELYKSLLK